MPEQTLTVVRTRGYYAVVPMLQQTVRASRVAIGLALVVGGAILALPFVPGPGLLLVFGGLGLLSGEFEWARRLRERMRDLFRRAARTADGR
jgi:uncharacterized membrane protein HdeD (DUF308 family)